jgi:hypothetical protein
VLEITIKISNLGNVNDSPVIIPSVKRRPQKILKESACDLLTARDVILNVTVYVAYFDIIAQKSTIKQKLPAWPCSFNPRKGDSPRESHLRLPHGARAHERTDRRPVAAMCILKTIYSHRHPWHFPDFCLFLLHLSGISSNTTKHHHSEISHQAWTKLYK